MALTQDGSRPRYYAERKKVETQQGNPIRDDVSREARLRIAHEITARTLYRTKTGSVKDFEVSMHAEMNRVFLRTTYNTQFRSSNFVEEMADLELDDFLQALEIGGAYLTRFQTLADINALQSLLADDLSVYRFVDTGDRNWPRYQIQRIDNRHLHSVITDRTFELTTSADFASAQNDYADAWRHYSKGDLDDAVANAGKAVESACKAVVKKADPASTPNNLNLGPLVTELVRLNVIPQQMQNMSNQLEQIFRGSGTLRNQAGTAHGSLDPASPEASVALLALRMSGTLISFLAERWNQLKPQGQ